MKSLKEWKAGKSFFAGALCSLMLGFSACVGAVSGITSNNASPHYSDFTNQETFEDIRVKVLGGHVRMTRRWDGSQWIWNSRWNDISSDKGQTIFEAQDAWINTATSETTTSPVATLAENPSLIIYRAGQVYAQVSSNTDQTMYENQLRQFITQHANGYSWTDSKGNGIEYDIYGRIISYYDRQGIYVYIDRDRDGYISHIKDHHQNIVLTYAWESIPNATAKKNLYGEEYFPKRLSSLNDYIGRKVEYKWNENNQLVEIVDVLDSVWQFVYNAGGELTQQIDPEGRVTTYVIAASGRFTSRFNQDGVGMSYTYSYDKDNEEYYLAEKQSSGLVNETWFDAMGHVVRKSSNGEEQSKASITLSDNSLGPQKLVKRYSSSTVYWYRGNELVHVEEPSYLLPQQSSNPIYVKHETTVDSRGNKTTREYDQWKNEISITHPDGSRVIRTWNTKYALPLTTKNENGVITAYEYDHKGNLSTLTEAKDTEDERVTRYTYDEYGQLKTRTTGESAANNTALATTEYNYDAYGNITRIIDPLGHITLFQDHDALGNASKIIDARANAQVPIQSYSWIKTFDAAGNVLTSFDPYGKGDIYSYNKSGDLLTITEANGSITTLTSNASGLPTAITNSSEHITKLEYDKANRVTSVIDANGNQNRMTYDIQGRLAATIDGENNATRYEYAHNLLSKVQYPTFSETLGYDNRDRIRENKQQANNKHYLRKKTYDVSGNLRGNTDANNNNESYEYDKLDRINKVIDAEGGITTFTYDARDNLLEVEDPEGRLTVYRYDLNDQLISETKHDAFLADGDTTTQQRRYNYDANGNLVSSINPAQEKTTYEYDQADRLIKTQVYSSASSTQPIKIIHYSTNAKNQFIGYSQQVGTGGEGNSVTGITPDIIPLSETYTYTALNQLETVTVNLGAFSKSYSYSYYPNGLKQTYTNPEGITYTYYYNKNNQLTAVHIPGNGQLTYSNFKWLAPETLLLPGGNKITLSYNDFLQVQERILKDPADNNLASAVYEYDLENNINRITSELGSYSFDYDNLYRLTNADYPLNTAVNDEAFAYDGVGNRTGHTLIENVDTQSSNATTKELAYNNQNQVTKADTATYTYNVNGHTHTKTENGQVTEYVYNHEERLIAVKVNTITVGEYAYHPNGMRIKKTVNGKTIFYFYNDKGLAAEYDGSGNLIKEYHFHPQKTWMTDPLFQRTADHQIYYYQNDHLGTPQKLIRSNGAVVWSATYGAFGEASISTTSIVENNLRFPGQYYDNETALHHNYFRDYDSRVGRYIQSDPIGLEGGINVYVYVEANPVIAVDPYGLLTCKDNLTRCRAGCRRPGTSAACLTKCEEKFGALGQCKDDKKEDSPTPQAEPTPGKPSSWTDSSGCVHDFEWKYGMWYPNTVCPKPKDCDETK